MTGTRTAAFSLVEVTLALGISAFALIAIFGLLPVGLQVSRAAGEQNSASSILAAIAADLRATPTSGTTSPLFGITIPGNASTTSSSTLFFSKEGEHSSQITGNSRYAATVTFSTNSAGVNGASFSNVAVSWPAAAAAANVEGSVESFVAIVRN